MAPSEQAGEERGRKKLGQLVRKEKKKKTAEGWMGGRATRRRYTYIRIRDARRKRNHSRSPVFPKGTHTKGHDLYAVLIRLVANCGKPPYDPFAIYFSWT